MTNARIELTDAQVQSICDRLVSSGYDIPNGRMKWALAAAGIYCYDLPDGTVPDCPRVEPDHISRQIRAQWETEHPT